MDNFEKNLYFLDKDYLYDLLIDNTIRKHKEINSEYQEMRLVTKEKHLSQLEMISFTSNLRMYLNNENKHNVIYSFDMYFSPSYKLKEYLLDQISTSIPALGINLLYKESKYLDFSIEISDSETLNINENFLRGIIVFFDNPPYFLENNINLSEFNQDGFSLFQMAKF